MRILCSVLLLLLLSSCALAEGPPATPAPPITLAAPPPVALEGDCTVTSGLDNWLQSTELFVSDFMSTLNDAANKPREALYEDVILMSRLRDATSELVAPECVIPTHLLLVDTMNTVVENFQAYANGDRDELGNTVPEAIGQFDRVIAGQNDLKARLEVQYRTQGGS